jgi:hypothetical protein
LALPRAAAFLGARVVEGLNHIDASKSVQDKIADLARLVESEAEAAKLKTIGEAWKFMNEKLDFAFQYQGV